MPATFCFAASGTKERGLIASVPTVTNPFPGLRPFESEETQLFFGRDGQTDELLRRLARARFLAVVGTSGSGKSSLVRAGLLPSLLGGFMAVAGSGWRIALFRPGPDPIRSLAEALNKRSALGGHQIDHETHQMLLEITLRRSSLGLTEVARQARMEPHENLLLVVDQFEELFRFRRAAKNQDSDQAAAFVKLLLEASHQTELPVYIVLTMRSDFLGDCAQFRHLPETLNEGQYLIPHMTRDQLRQVIEGPVAVGDAEIAPRLVQRLLNEVADDTDHLPILQHALMRTWDFWRECHTEDEPVDLHHYERIGGMANALSVHANEALDELPDQSSKTVAQKLFQRITEVAPDGRATRRPTRLDEICAVVGLDESQVIKVIDRFRRSGRAFLMPPAEEKLRADSVIDISHESLIRLWDHLREWMQAELDSGKIYKELADAAKRYDVGQASLWRDPELQLALDWRQKNSPNPTWAQRYDTDFETAMRFLEKSRKDLAARKLFRYVELIGLPSIVILAILIFFLWQALNHFRALYSVAEARQLAFQSEIARSEQASLLEPSALLAIESVRRAPLLENDIALRQSLALLGSIFSRKPAANFSVPGRANAVAFSPDGRYLAVGSNAVHVFDLSSGKEMYRLSDGSAVSAVAFSPDGRLLATSRRSGSVELLDPVKGRVLRSLVNGYDSTGVAWSPDGKRFAASGDRGIRVWDTYTTKEILTLAGFDSFTKVAWSPDGTRCAAVGRDEATRLWDAATGRLLLNIKSTTDVAWSPSGKVLAIASGAGGFVVYEAATGRQLQRSNADNRVPFRSVAWTPDGRYLTTIGLNGIATLFEASTGSVVSHLSLEGATSVVAFSPDGRYLAAGDESGAVRLFESVGPDVVSRLSHEGSVLAVACSQNGTYVATTAWDRKVRVFDAAGGKLLWEVPHLARVSVAFSADGRWFVTGSSEGTATVFDAASGRAVSQLRDLGQVAAVALSSDGHYVAAGSVNGITSVFEATTGERVSVLSQMGLVNAVAFGPDGHYVATGSSDKTAHVFEVRSGREVSRLAHSDSVMVVTFSPDGSYVATGSADNTARVFDVPTGKQIWRLNHQGPVNAVLFSPNGLFLATASFDRTARLLEMRSGVEVTRLNFASPVLAVVFGNDSETLITATSASDAEETDVLIRKDLLSPHDLIAEACSRLTRNLTTEEWKQYLRDEPYRKTCPNLR